MSDGMQVLYAGRDAELADLTATSLERGDERLTVGTTTSARDCFDRLDDFDCVVSAYDLDGPDGVEFLEMVRQEFPDLPFILIPDGGSEEVASRAISAGATDYVPRGSDADWHAEIADRIRESVDRYRERRDLERSHRRLLDLAESTADCLWIFDREWEELLFISGYEEIWGRPTEAIRENPQDFLNGVHPDHQDYVERAMDRLSDGEPLDIEYPIRKREDEPGWVWAKGEPVVDDGDVVRVVGFTREVTDRKERERELERYETLVHETSDIVTVVDAAGSIRYQSPSIERVLGYDRDELVGESAFEYIHPEDRQSVTERLSELDSESDGSYRIRYRMRRADGEWRWLESGASNRTETAIDGYVIASRDITERVEQERELERYREYTGRIIDAIDDLFFVHDEDGGMQRWNDRFAAMTGYSDPEIGSMNGVDFIPEPDRERAASQIEQVFETGHARLEAPILTKDGDTIPHEFVANRVVTPNGEPRLAGIGRDITERKRRERELERQNERLEEFASFVSHDLRTPLQILVGSLDEAARTGADEHFDRCYETVDRMGRMIDDLLTLAREGTAVVDPEPVRLAELSERCWGNVETPDAELAVDTSRTVLADGDRVTRLLENLFRNAVEHGSTDPDSQPGRDSDDHPDPVRITVGDIPDGFYVEDDGPGVPGSERDRVFDAGYSTTPDGTGIGLRIVDEIAAAHGWEVDVTAGSDGGARFEMTGVDAPNR